MKCNEGHVALPSRVWLLTMRDGTTYEDSFCCGECCRWFYEQFVQSDRMNDVVKVEKRTHESR